MIAHDVPFKVPKLLLSSPSLEHAVKLTHTLRQIKSLIFYLIIGKFFVNSKNIH